MKKKILLYDNGKNTEKHIVYVPIRFVLAMIIIVLEILAVFTAMAVLAIYVPYFALAELATQIGCVFSIIARKDNPDYKVPWLIFVLVVPVIGFMCYLMFYTRKLSFSQRKKLNYLKTHLFTTINNCPAETIEDEHARSQAIALNNLSGAKLYKGTDVQYFPSGETYFVSLLKDLRSAKEFIFIEYFIIEQGLFWNCILDVLKEKVSEGVSVKVLYDDIGCMTKLPGNYFKKLRKMGIECALFSKLRGQANNEFNNRNHRKLTVIDGKIGYTGGINIADEYINHVQRFGHWKDVGIRLEGAGVNAMTQMFLGDFELSLSKTNHEYDKYFKDYSLSNDGFVVPFGDGPNPIYDRQVSKSAIINMLGQAKDYVHITTPYLIIDDQLCQAIENTALRGVDVKIITPHIADKKIIHFITRSHYERLIKAGVKIYEYSPGFIHAKTYVADDKYAIIGTVNLDYRSLVHHFENGVWIYNHQVIKDIADDFNNTLSNSQEIAQKQFAGKIVRRFFVATLKVFAPLL